VTVRPIAVCALVFSLLVALGLGYVYVRLGVIHAGYAIADELRELRELEEEGRRLKVELSLLRDPARLEKLAREQLGMSRPDPSAIRRVRVGDGAIELSAARPVEVRAR
jgi:cell division protein FtsL